MPESVSDRPTRAHETIFLLSKRRHYFCDMEAIREPIKPSSIARLRRGVSDHHKNIDGAPGQDPHTMLRPRKNVRFGGDKAAGYGTRTASGKEWSPDDAPGAGNIAARKHVDAEGVPYMTANKRDVWTITPVGYKGAHFATFPLELAELCVLAGSSARGCCPECGKPWRRVIKKTGGTIGHSWHNHQDDDLQGQRTDTDTHADDYERTSEWTQDCECLDLDPVPCVVLDPFSGSGTVAVAATMHRRAGIAVELKPDYLNLIQERLTNLQIRLF